MEIEKEELKNLIKSLIQEVNLENKKPKSKAQAGTTFISGLPDGVISLTDYLPFDPATSADTYRGSVQSLINIVSSDLPPAPGGIYTPTFAPFSGISGDADLFSAKYIGNVNSAGGIIIATTKFEVTADGSNDLMGVKITNPFPGNFSNPEDASSLSFSIIKTANVDVPGAIGDGCFHNLVAEIGGGVVLTFEGAQPSVSYLVIASWIYQIQSLLVTQENKNKRKLKNV